MELTSLEKIYYDEFSKSFGKYGNDIPREEWERLNKICEGLDITLKRLGEIMKDVQRNGKITEQASKGDGDMLFVFKRGVKPLLRHHNNVDCVNFPFFREVYRHMN